MLRTASVALIGILLMGLLLMGCGQPTPTPSPTPTATPTPRETIYSWNLTTVKEVLNSRIADLSWLDDIGLEGDKFESGDFDHGYFALLDSKSLVLYLLTSTPKATQIDILTSLFMAVGYEESEAKYVSEIQVERGRILNSLERSAFRTYGYIVGSSPTFHNCIGPGKISASTLDDMHLGDPSYSKMTILAARSSSDWTAAEPC